MTVGCEQSRSMKLHEPVPSWTASSVVASPNRNQALVRSGSGFKRRLLGPFLWFSSLGGASSDQSGRLRPCDTRNWMSSGDNAASFSRSGRRSMVRRSDSCRRH